MKTQTYTPLEEYLAEQHWHVELPHFKAWRVTQKLSLAVFILFLASIGWAFYYGWNLAEKDAMHWMEILKAVGPMIAIGMLMSVVLPRLKYRYNYSNYALKQRAALLSVQEQVKMAATRLSAQLSSIIMETSKKVERERKMLEFMDNHQRLLELPEVQNLVWPSLFAVGGRLEDRGVLVRLQGQDDREFGLWLQEQYSPAETV